MAGSHAEERLAVLLRALPPAPPDWVLAAGAHPEVRRALAELDVRGLDDPRWSPARPDAQGEVRGRDADMS